MQILNKSADIRSDVCYRVSSSGKLCEISKENVEKILASFEELRRDGKSISNTDDLQIASRLTRERHLARIKKLEEQERMQRNAGFALVSSITLVGTIALATIIFMTIKLFVF